MAEGACLKIDEKEFCYSRAIKCPCSKALDYTSHYKAKVDAWGKYLQLRQVTKKGKLTLEAYRRASEHHHIVCVSAIQTVIGDPKVYAYASATTWCINEKVNLIGLPMWALHLMHYCDLLGRDPAMQAQRVAGVWMPTVEPPPFSNLPMHDQDHDLYLKEVDDDLAKIATDLPEVKDCQDPEKTLKEEIDQVSKNYSLQLNMNARAYGGTHNAWTAGMNGDASWYVAFSMSRSPRKRVHPMYPGDYEDKLNELHKSFWLEGNPIVFG
jgi:hypothetical protein